MSVIDEIKKLDAKKKSLLSKAKAEALKTAQKAVADLNALGFDYALVDNEKPAKKRAQTVSGKRPRRTGMRDEVLKVIKKSEAGLKRKEILEKLKASDKSAQQSVSNALAVLKKSNAITQDGRVYKMV